jgi:hypothetical protein
MQRSVPVVVLLLAPLVLVLLSAPSTTGRTWYIKPDGTGDAPTIQAGVDSSAVWDTVLVVAGTYHDCTHVDPDGWPNSVLITKPVVLRSEAGPHQTTIDAQGDGRVLWCYWIPSIIEGFTMTGGTATLGGGVHLIATRTKVRDCVFQANQATYGGGLYIDNCSPDTVQIAECSFTNNSATAAGGLGAFCGALAVRSCLIIHNTSSSPGYGAFHVFTGIGSVTVTESIISNNYCHGLTVDGHHDPTIELDGVTVAGNTDPQMCLWDAIPHFTRVLCVGQFICSTEYLGSSYTYCDFFRSEGSSWCFGTWYTPNLNQNPLFCDAAAGDYSLAANSPCLPENNQWGVLVGALGEGCGPIARLQETWA